MTRCAFILLSSENLALTNDPGRIWMGSTRLKTARSAVDPVPAHHISPGQAIRGLSTPRVAGLKFRHLSAMAAWRPA
jgi:hypothetical protein